MKRSAKNATANSASAKALERRGSSRKDERGWHGLQNWPCERAEKKATGYGVRRQPAEGTGGRVLDEWTTTYSSRGKDSAPAARARRSLHTCIVYPGRQT